MFKCQFFLIFLLIRIHFFLFNIHLLFIPLFIYYYQISFFLVILNFLKIWKNSKYLNNFIYLFILYKIKKCTYFLSALCKHYPIDINLENILLKIDSYYQLLKINNLLNLTNNFIIEDSIFRILFLFCRLITINIFHLIHLC